MACAYNLCIEARTLYDKVNSGQDMFRRGGATHGCKVIKVLRYSLPAQTSNIASCVALGFLRPQNLCEITLRARSRSLHLSCQLLDG